MTRPKPIFSNAHADGADFDSKLQCDIVTRGGQVGLDGLRLQDRGIWHSEIANTIDST